MEKRSPDGKPLLRKFGSDISINVLASIIASVVFLVAGFFWGKYHERHEYGKNLDQYDFDPSKVKRYIVPEFNLNDFLLAMHYLLKNTDYTAARQLIFIGEQNDVRSKLDPSEQRVYAALFDKYDGKKIADDTAEYLENYARIVRLVGKSFPDSGIEILLHNLADPAHSLVALENNVTGRHLRDGTTSLLLDLKRRQLQNEDKLNYELNIGARKFKCTTIPIIRKDYGVVGAICINVDVNYLTDDVMNSKEHLESFFTNLCSTDMHLDK